MKKIFRKTLTSTFSFLIGLFVITTPVQAYELSPTLNQDVNRVFTKVPHPSEIRALNQQEMREIRGALGPIVAVVTRAAGGAFISGGIRVGDNYVDHRPLMDGVEYAATVGVINGVVTGKLVDLSGGGLAGNAAWRPGIFAITQGV